MKLNLRIASLLVVIGIFGFSTTVLAQTNKKTATNAQAPAEAEANKTRTTKPKNDRIKQTTNINLSKDSNRPASTGTGNGNNRPASTGETLSERDRIERANQILMFAGTFPNGTVEDSGSNLSRTRGFIQQAFNNAWTLKNRYINANNQNVNYESNYTVPSRSDMNDVKSNLQQALNYLNGFSFETQQNHRANAIDFTTRAISQIDAYLINPPAAKRKQPTKKAPNNAKPKTISNVSGAGEVANSEKSNDSTATSKPKAQKQTANSGNQVIDYPDLLELKKSNPKTRTKNTTPKKP